MLTGNSKRWKQFRRKRSRSAIIEMPPAIGSSATFEDLDCDITASSERTVSGQKDLSALDRDPGTNPAITSNTSGVRVFGNWRIVTSTSPGISGTAFVSSICLESENFPRATIFRLIVLPGFHAYRNP